jgi:hypothetical protein
VSWSVGGVGTFVPKLGEIANPTEIQKFVWVNVFEKIHGIESCAGVQYRYLVSGTVLFTLWTCILQYR